MRYQTTTILAPPTSQPPLPVSLSMLLTGGRPETLVGGISHSWVPVQFKNQWDLEQLTAPLRGAQLGITQDYIWETQLGIVISMPGSQCSSWSLKSKERNVPSARLKLFCMLHCTADVSVDVFGWLVGSLCFIFK